MNLSIKSRFFTLVICSLFLLSGCGRTAHPVASFQPGDEQKSCSHLTSEMTEINGQIAKLLPQENKTGKNVALGIAGAFLIVPWLFMDFSDAEAVEINAYRTRFNHLVRVYNDKHCGAKISAMPLLKGAPKANSNS